VDKRVLNIHCDGLNLKYIFFLNDDLKGLIDFKICENETTIKRVRTCSVKTSFHDCITRNTGMLFAM